MFGLFGVRAKGYEFSMASSQVLVRVPASTSNFGPGFDCLGTALSLHNTVRVARADGAPSQRGMIADTATAFFQRAAGGKLAPFGFEATIEGEIPVSRGLGSSVTVRLGLLLGLAELVKESALISHDEILQLLIELEGHPDNAVASFLGGFVVCARATSSGAGGFSYTRVPVDSALSFVALIPELRLSTEEARGILPSEVSLRHAVENSQRTARIAASFCTRDYAALRDLFMDHFHQPFRCDLVPGFDDILAAAVEAGALGSFLSGAGSTLMALTLERPAEISEAMLKAARKHGLAARAVVLKADNEGARIFE